MLGILCLSCSMLIFPLACPAEGRYICRPEEPATSQADANPKQIPGSARNLLQPPRQKECASVLVGAAIQVTTREKSKIGYLVRIAHFLCMKKRAFEQIDPGGCRRWQGSAGAAKGDNRCQAGTCEGRSNWASTRVASEDTGRGTSAGRARK